MKNEKLTRKEFEEYIDSFKTTFSSFDMTSNTSEQIKKFPKEVVILMLLGHSLGSKNLFLLFSILSFITDREELIQTENAFYYLYEVLSEKQLVELGFIIREFAILKEMDDDKN